MVWPVIPGSPHGGPLPVVAITSILPFRAYQGDTVVIYGSGFTPGTEVRINPGNILIGVSMSTVTDEITITVPYGLVSMRYVMTVSNDDNFDTTNLSVISDVTFSTPSGLPIDLLISEMS